MDVVYVKTEDIKPYHKKLRNNDETVKSLVKLISRIGFNVPIVIDKENVIVKGDARYRAARELGFEELPCIVSNNSDEINGVDRVADNRISELSGWDYSLLEYELSGLETDLRDTGLEFSIMKQGIREVTSADIESAENKQSNIGTPESVAYLSVNCPKCGGYFEYKKSGG